MKSTLYTLAILFCVSSLYSQKEPYYKNYDWDTDPISNIKIEDYKDKDMVSFKDKTVNEFYFINKEQFVEYALIHKLYWLNSNDNIEKYNKVYLPSATAGSKIVKNKARVITKEGKIIELDDSKILTSKDEETQRTYTYYALEGIEKGGFIEYYYVVQRYPSYTGKRIFLQSEFDKKNTEFQLFAPTSFKFQVKSYNDLPEVKLDTTNKDKNHWKLSLDHIEGLKTEEQAPYNAMRKYIVYKLQGNTNNPGVDVISYRIGAQNIYKNLYGEENSKLNTKIKKFLKSIKGSDNEDVVTKVRAIENYIKANIYIGKMSREDLEDISSIIDNKVANQSGIVKLYIAIFKSLGIKHQIVYTTDRRDMVFDKDFEAYNFLQENLIYLTKQKLYMDPSSIESRLGFPPGHLTDNYGLFIKQVTLGDVTSAVGRIKYIKPVNYDKTNYDLVMNVSFDPEDLTVTKLKMDRKMSGYYSVYLQPIMEIAKEENKKEIIEGIIKSINQNLEIIDKEVLHATAADFGKNPLQIIANLKSEEFVEKAGPKYLFKLGELIGTQQEMYQEKVRVLPAQNQFERSYDRKIVVDIPEGYQLKNLDKINISESFKQDEEELFMFSSSYELKDNQLIVSIKEFYNKNIIDLDIYEKYRTVVNSAANFNKVTLILEKK